MKGIWPKSPIKARLEDVKMSVSKGSPSVESHPQTDLPGLGCCWGGRVRLVATSKKERI